MKKEVMQKFTLILFRLPDGKIVLQRRTRNANYAPGKLGIFGGWVENCESVKDCLLREIKEETSLDIDKLEIKFNSDFIVPSGEDFDKDRHFYLYETVLDNLNFEVYEGEGAEAYSLKELRNRQDLSGSAEYVINRLLP